MPMIKSGQSGNKNIKNLYICKIFSISVKYNNQAKYLYLMWLNTVFKKMEF
jgi:hypothetical protein